VLVEFPVVVFVLVAVAVAITARVALAALDATTGIVLVLFSSASCILSLIVLSKLCNAVDALIGRDAGLLIPLFSLAIAMIYVIRDIN